MRDLRYGIEIEMTGLSRGKAAETLAGFFGTRAEHTGGGYDAYAVRDAQDRVWKLVSDGSIQTQKKVRGQTVAADSTYSVELVSPVCVYEDIGTIQEIVRALRRNSALVNDSCGIVPFPVSWTVKMKKKQKETQDILSYHTQAAGCSDKARAKASGGRQPIEECGRTGL